MVYLRCIKGFQIEKKTEISFSGVGDPVPGDDQSPDNH